MAFTAGTITLYNKKWVNEVKPEERNPVSNVHVTISERALPHDHLTAGRESKTTEPVAAELHDLDNPCSHGRVTFSRSTLNP